MAGVYQCLSDGIDLFGHVFADGYHSNAVIEKTTFRDWAYSWDTRDFHVDAIQTGTAADRHLGYRVLVTDTVAHMADPYGGSNGAGGGTQGFFNDDHLTADNQFVVRRSTFLVSAYHGFTYHSPRASRPSFVDKSTFMRAGVIPSAFAPDNTQQDSFVAISTIGSEPAGGPWLLVTDTLAKSGAIRPAVAAATVVEVDPRSTATVAEPLRPEKVFVGRDFGRGNAAANGVSGKFGYALPAEATSRSRFVADVWANFQPQGGAIGAPDLRHLAWTN